MSDAAHPRAANDLVGHEDAERRFLDAWNSGRLAHAWLLCGPRGIGKATLAYRIARFVLSGGGDGGLFGAPDSLAVAPEHPVFRRVASGGHADLKVVERSWTDDKPPRLRSEIVVDDVREIGRFLSHTPAEGGWRVVIIDAADEMNRNSANAVLKVLEEPPQRALLLLVSHSPGRLLPTIRSRCRRLTLRPLAEEQLLTLLLDRSELSEADARALARLAEGSIGKALALAGEGGLALFKEIIGLLARWPRLDVAAVHAFSDRVARGGSGEAFRTVTDLFVWWLARMVRVGGRGEGLAEVVPGEAAVMERLLGASKLDQWLEVWEKTSHLFARAEAVNLDRKQVVLNAFLTVERQGRP